MSTKPPLPFCFTDGQTYADTGDKTVWVRGGASGLDKRQCTVQLTVFADGEPRVRPLLIFRGLGKRISLREKVCIYVTLLVVLLLKSVHIHAAGLRLQSKGCVPKESLV